MKAPIEVKTELLPFFFKDEKGSFGKVISGDKKSVTLDLDGGLSVKLTMNFEMSLSCGDKLYFNTDGKFAGKEEVQQVKPQTVQETKVSTSPPRTGNPLIRSKW